MHLLLDIIGYAGAMIGQLLKYLTKCYTIGLERRFLILTIATAVVVALFGLSFFLVAGVEGQLSLFLWIISVFVAFALHFFMTKRILVAPVRKILTKMEALHPMDERESAEEGTDESRRIGSTADQVSNHVIEIKERYDALSIHKEQVDSEFDRLLQQSARLEQSLRNATEDASNLKLVGEEMNRDAENIVEVAKSSFELSRQGVDHVEMSKKAMMEINESERSILESNSKVNVNLKEVNEIISMVSDVASQSKLLAINASIEAAKAGDAGRGFSVVAREMKSLSIKSKQATTRASEIIKNIRSAISEMQGYVSEGNKRTRRGTEILDETEEIISRLGSIISEISEAAYIISVSANEQSIGLDTVDTTIADLHKTALAHQDDLKRCENGDLLGDVLAASGKLMQDILQGETQAGAPRTKTK